MTSLKDNLLEAVPISRLVSESSGVTVGIEYCWNTGERAILWRDQADEDTIRLPIENATNKPD